VATLLDEPPSFSDIHFKQRFDMMLGESDPAQVEGQLSAGGI
jgi:hypothetical protein